MEQLNQIKLKVSEIIDNKNHLHIINELIDYAYTIGKQSVMQQVIVKVLPEYIDFFSTPSIIGIVFDEDDTHIWINSIINRYPKYMINIIYL